MSGTLSELTNEHAGYADSGPPDRWTSLSSRTADRCIPHLEFQSWIAGKPRCRFFGRFGEETVTLCARMHRALMNIDTPISFR